MSLFPLPEKELEIAEAELVDAYKRIAALEAEVKALRSLDREWVPIDSAPMDKTMVALLRVEKNWQRHGVGWYMPLTGWQAWTYDKPPTHWYPLPAAPGATK